ncbi:hypothetical protein BLNAU_727 [Blattamonas nauphoetae]|uniref:Uncharacterized protein n=1 Tax=Blattamonas nauphoetae TaxID=2049346 RepID=A0ABQ9YKB5_9EUKA|nr:hypothetical protein BLNAU_727 [Blattamonas nauphoetae]
MANPLPPQSRADVAQSSLFNPHLNPIPPKPYYTRPNTVQTLRGNIRTIASLQKSKRDADDQLMSLKRTYLTNFKQATNGRASSFLALKRKISQLSHQVLQTRELLNSFPFIIRNYVETQRGTPMTKATNSIFRRFPQGKLALLQDTFALHREFIFMSTHLKQRTLCLHHIKQTLQQQLDHYLNTAIQSLQTVFTVEPLPPQLILSTSPSITKKKGAQTHEQALFQSMVGVPDFKFDAASLFQSRRITSTPTTSPLASAFLCTIPSGSNWYIFFINQSVTEGGYVFAFDHVKQSKDVSTREIQQITLSYRANY